MENHESHRILMRFIAIGFILNFVLIVISLGFTPDMESNPPVYQHPQLILQALATAALVFSSTLIGLKLAEDKQILPAAGFTMLSIASALSIVVYFEFRTFSVEEFEKIYDIYLSYVALLVPTAILLVYYKDVPKWQRFLPIVSVIIQSSSMVVYYSGYEKYNKLDSISFIGYLIFTVLTLLWGIQIWRKSVKQITET